MKCLVSKNSVFKSAILTLVGLLCFVGVSVGQITFTGDPANQETITTTTCSGKTIFHVKGGYSGIYIKSNGNNIIDNTPSGYTVDIGSLGTQKWSNTMFTDRNCYYVVEVVGNTIKVTKYASEPPCVSISGTPEITPLSSYYCDDAKPTLSVVEGSVTVTADSGYPQYEWYNSSDELVATTTAPEWEATGVGTYYCVVKADASTASAHSNTVVLSSPTGLIFSTTENSLEFEHNLCPSADAPTKTFTFTRKSGCDNADAADVNSLVSIVGTDAAKFSKSVRKTATGTYEVTVTCVSTEAGTFDDASLVISEGGEMVSVDLSATVTKPSIALSSSSLTLTNENGATPKVETITVTRNNSCAEVQVTNSNSTDFEVVKVDDNTFTITYKNNTYDSEASPATGTITFSSAGAISQTLTVEGSVSACSETAVATFEFGTALENSVAGSSVTFATGLSKSTHDYDGSGYTIKSTSHFQNSNNPVGGTGNVFVAKADNDATMFTISGLDPSFVYSISMTAGSNTKRYSGSVTTTFTVGTKTYQVTKNSDESKNISIENCVLPQGTSSLVVKAKTEGSSSGNHVYFDDIVITKLCPPDVKMTVADECTEGAMTFTAQASVMSASTIASYQWYKDGVAISGATSATFTPTTTYAKGSRITVKVTDDLGMTAESKPYVYDCGATIESVSLDATSDFYCAGMTITANVVASPETGYPIYKWYKDGSEISGATSDTYQPSEAGTYTVRVYADASVYKEASKTLAVVTPTIDAPSVVEYTAEKDGDAQQETITISLENSCSTLVTEITGDYASMYSITDNHNGTYTITFTPNSTKGIYLATLELQSVDGAVSKSVTLNGNVLNCVANSLGTFDFSTNSVGSTVAGLSLSTSLTNTMTDKNAPRNGSASGYKVGSTPWFNYVQGFSGTSGECLQIAYQENGGTDKVHIFTLTGTVDDTKAYKISFLAGENANWDAPNKIDYYVGDNTEPFASISKSSSSTISAIVSASELASGAAIYAKFGESSRYKMSYYDNIVISSVCPPEIEFVSVDACDVNSEVVAMAEQGTAAIKQYDWYIIDGDDDDEPVATHVSSSDRDTYTQATEIGHGKTIKVVVTDENGITAEASVVVNCGPEIEDITAPAKICPNTDLTMSVPSITAQTGDIKAQGWEISQNENAASEDWTTVTSLEDLSGDYDDWYIRYFAVDSKGRGKSNAVQITMFDAPTIGDFTVENICQGETFTLNPPTVMYDPNMDLSKTSSRWEYATESDFSDKEELTESLVLSADTYYVRYVATDCKDFYSDVKEVEVYTPHIEVTYANSTYYRTATSLLPVTEEPNLEHPCVDGPFTYTIISGNENGYFTIDASTGVISLTSEALNATVGGYPITVTATNGTITSDPTPLTITISNDPELTLDCSASETYYVYSKYQKLNIDKIVSSAYVNADVTLSLTGSDVSNFELSSSSVSGNLVQHVIITNSDDFSGAGTYTLTLTATTEGDGTLTKECDMTVVVRDIDISSEKNDQTVCGGIAETLSVTVTGEDQTNLPLSYQWYKGTTAIAGATSKDFVPTEDGVYSCKVSLDGEVIYTSEVSEVKFAPDSPIVTFKGTVPDEVYCSQEISLELSIVDKNNNDLSSSYNKFMWEKNNNLMKSTSNGSYTFSFECSQDAGNPIELSVTFSDSNNGCEYVVSKTVLVKAFDKVYYYCGSTGNDSDLTNVNNWCTAENANTSSCTHPDNFTTAGCNYVINKDNVILKEGETWTVSGAGTKVTIGNGKWASTLSDNSSKTSSFNHSALGYSFMVSSYKVGSEALEILSDMADYDFRNSAKQFNVQGTINLNDGVTIDVRRGSELVIETENGNPTIAMCETDLLACAYSDGYGCLESQNIVYNAAIVPGAIVTYKDAGAKAIQATQYSNLYINTSDEVQFKSGEVEISQNMKLDQTPSSVVATGSSIVYDGKVNQSVAPIVYDNVSFYNSTNKNIAGDVEVMGQMIVGAGSTLNGGNNGNTIKLTSCDADPVVDYRGFFEAGNSTVWYAGNDCNQKVSAMPYYNLKLSDGDKTFENKNIIGIANQFTVDQSKNYTVTGSTVEFNGTTAQEIPEFTFSKLSINNTALSKGFSETNTVKMTGDVTVQDQLLLSEGVLTVNGNTLLVTNTASNAVMDGYYSSNTEQSFINGILNRTLPAEQSGSDISSMYVFPVGNMTDGYLPLTLSQITTGSAPTVAVSAIHGNLSSRGKDSELTALETDYYWDVEEVGGSSYTSGRVSISTAKNTALGADNCVAYSSSDSDPFSQLSGTALTNSLIRSKANGQGVYTFGTININKKDYYYNCNNGEDINNPANWYTLGGVPATSFSEDYATWTIQSGCGSSCGSETSRKQNNIVTVSSTDVDGNIHNLSLDGLTGCSVTFSEPIEITGSNSELVLEKGVTLTISSEATFAAVHQQEASNIFVNNEMTVLEKYTIDEVNQAVSTGTDGSHDANTREPLQAKIINSGVVNIMASKFELSDAWFVNKSNAQTNFVNSDFSIICKTGANNHYNNGNAGHFINCGSVFMENSGLTVKGRFAQLQNVNGANWIIDNRLSAYRGVIKFDDMEFYHEAENYVSMECGSSFIVRKSDVELLYKGYVADVDNCPVKIGGDFVVEDGNLHIRRSTGESGGTVTIEHSCGSLMLYDTDNTNDGIITMESNGGGTNFNVEGKMYTMGFVQEGGSGAKMTIKDGGFAFIGDMGAVLSGYTWNYKITVNEGGVMHYCGNKTAAGDAIGTNMGALYYAENYYIGDDPIHQGDFTNENNAYYAPLYESMEACMEAFNEGASPEKTETLLPIELTLLYAVCNEQGVVELHWQTASETNNDYFTILRSFDGVHFEELDIVWGAGTTTEFHNYEYFDSEDKEGVVYYKLRQTDYDGNTTESKVIAVQTCGTNAQFRITEDQIDIFFKHPEESSFVVITSITGQIFYSKSFRSTEAARIAAPQRKGIYIISVIDSKIITSEKFIR